MSQYKIAEGYNIALASLTLINPQPTTRGVQYTERAVNLDGTFTQAGPYCEMLWSAVGTEADYLTLLTQFGLNDSISNAVTVYLRNERLQYTRYNATATLPALGQDGSWSQYFLRDLVILLRDLEAL